MFKLFFFFAALVAMAYAKPTTVVTAGFPAPVAYSAAAPLAYSAPVAYSAYSGYSPLAYTAPVAYSAPFSHYY